MKQENQGSVYREGKRKRRISNAVPATRRGH